MPQMLLLKLWCADCGTPMPASAGSLPQGQARCHPCRRIRPTGSGAVCEHCRATFTSVSRGKRGGRTRFCSPECRNLSRMTSGEFIGKDHRARAERGGGKVERVNRVAVFERDGWLCGLCGMGINPDLRWPDPNSASLDHIVPLSRGGDHTYANVQAAHLRCNIAKGGTNRPAFARAA